MRIITLQEHPIETFGYLNAVPGGEVQAAQLPIYVGTISGLPNGLDALIVSSDLQGIVPLPYVRDNTEIASNSDVQISTHRPSQYEPTSSREEDCLLGEMLPDYVRLLLEVEMPEIDPNRVGVLLCGDLYARRGKRGASGNPVPVWLAFRDAFGWVAGVDGNHDLTDEAGARRLHSDAAIHYMDAPVVINASLPMDGLASSAASQPLRVAGLGGIIGRPDKPNRLPKEQYLQSLSKLLKQQPDCLVLHQSPGIAELGLMGEALIRQSLEAGSDTVVFCGHTHWHTSLVQLNNGTQIVNADSKLFIFTKEQDGKSEKG
ncbi:metallophosphoesterase family protein [Paenibacillus xylanexedens]|uniref:metallophosphoesterase family protein n=1 Tax=Paenibacillus xylanexedens TaxID=528191 RepID=UPI0011A5E53C|nr:metallophosphoesterase [Paenibacillus xylanexedens]